MNPSRLIVGRSAPSRRTERRPRLEPAFMPCMAMWAARPMSSYDELVQQPMSAALSSTG